MTTAVCIELRGGRYVTTEFPDRAKAVAFIDAWIARHAARIKNGQFDDIEVDLLSTTDLQGRTTSAIMAKFVLGMWIPPDKPSAVERVAAVMEKQLGAGEEWRGEE